MNCIDSETISSLLELDPEGGKELLRELVGMFTGMTPPKLQAIQTAFAREDAATIARECHSLKSSSGNLGAKRFSKLCAQIEGVAKIGTVAGIEAWVAELQPAYQEAEAGLQEVLAGLK